MNEKLLRILKKTGFVLLKTFLGLLIFFILLEFSYRWQIFDFYSTELNGLNSKEDLENISKPKILVFGDSFSATKDSWVSEVRKKFPGYGVINSAIPGTGIVQASLIARRRFKRFHPETVIYQYYTGNDLFDIRYPAKGNISLTRKMYWALANHFRSLSWINYKAGQWKGSYDPADAKKNEGDEKFIPSKYNARERTMIDADPGILSDQVLLNNGRHKDFLEWINYFSDLEYYFYPGSTKKFYVLVIPQAAQVDPEKREQLESLGAKFIDVDSYSAPEYPLITEMDSLLSNNITILNPFEMLRDSSKTQNLFYQHDPHLNPTGQKILGEWVAKRISEDVGK